MEELNDLYHRDIEIDKQMINVVVHDIYEPTKEYITEDITSIISAIIPAIDTVLKDKDKGLENKIKSDLFKNPSKLIPEKSNLLKLLNEIGKTLFKVIAKEYEFKKRFLEPQMKKLSDFLKKNKLLKDYISLRGFKIGIGLFDSIILFWDLGEIWFGEDGNYYEKILKTRKKMFEFTGEVLLGSIGYNIALALFRKPGATRFIMILLFIYIFAKIGTLLGDDFDEIINNIMKKLAGIAGDDDDDDDIFGLDFLNFLRRKKDDDDDNDDGDGGDPPLPPCAAFAVAMRSGGIEFHFPRQINNFISFFSFNKSHYIAFEYDDDLDIQEIIDLVNSKFLINNIKVKSLDEIYDTILKEIAYGFLCRKELPSISLNFNKDGLLYSIMNNYY